jgi:hypothetical protein
VWIPGNKKADNAVTEAFNENLDRTKKYPLQDLVNGITEQHEEQQQTQWETGSQMRNRKPQRTKRNDTSEMKKRDQVAISRLRTGYSRATHSQIINHHQNAHCATQNLPLTTSYGHVKKRKQKETESTSQVKYGKEEKRKWKNSSSRKSNYTTVFEKKNKKENVKNY